MKAQNILLILSTIPNRIVFTISRWWQQWQSRNLAKYLTHFIRDFFKKHKSTLLFLKVFARNPKMTGAIWPSSKRLAKAIVSFVPKSKESKIIELGAGTGVFTEALIRSGINPKQIIAIEHSHLLAEQLKIRFPDIEVISGDAAQLVTLLGNQNHTIGTIISGLPLRSLPKTTVQAILKQIPMVLSAQGRFIQFTYDIRKDQFYYPTNYHLIKSKIVWVNLPPAKIEVFEKSSITIHNLISSKPASK